MQPFSLRQLAALYLLAGVLTAAAGMAPMEGSTLGLVHDTEKSLGNRMVSANVTQPVVQAFNHSAPRVDISLWTEGDGDPDVSITSSDRFDGVYPPGRPLRFLHIDVGNVSVRDAAVRLHYDEGELSVPEGSLSLWHLEDGEWHVAESEIHPDRDYVETRLSSLSALALAEAYADGFDDGRISPDWSPVSGYWYESHGFLVQDSVDTGVVINHGAAGNTTDYEASVDMKMSGEDRNFMSLLLRADGDGQEAVEARLNWETDRLEVGYLDRGRFVPVETRNFTEATGYSLWDDVWYRVTATAEGETVTLEVRRLDDGPEVRASLTARSSDFALDHHGVGLKGRDGPSGGKNLFDDLLVNHLPGTEKGKSGETEE